MTLCVAVLVLGFGGVALAEQPADDGQVSKATLAALGMSDMQIVSDAEGEQIRGKWGFKKPSFTAYQTQTIVNNWGSSSATQVVKGPCFCAKPDSMTQLGISAGYGKDWGWKGGSKVVSGTAVYQSIKF
jgi:hypothetical protein